MPLFASPRVTVRKPLHISRLSRNIPMRTALYLRVSTSHQKPDLQADGLRRYAASAGLEIVGEYLDVAVSGRKEGRPQLQTLMRAARHHEFACVLVWKFDRFARSVSHLLRTLEEFNQEIPQSLLRGYLVKGRA
jgi:DNA invertase Pin-like site-specific DNA recombinase